MEIPTHALTDLGNHQPANHYELQKHVKAANSQAKKKDI